MKQLFPGQLLAMNVLSFLVLNLNSFDCTNDTEFMLYCTQECKISRPIIPGDVAYCIIKSKISPVTCQVEEQYQIQDDECVPLQAIFHFMWFYTRSYGLSWFVIQNSKTFVVGAKNKFVHFKMGKICNEFMTPIGNFHSKGLFVHWYRGFLHNYGKSEN